MNLSGSFVWVFVNGLILVTYDLPDNLSVFFFLCFYLYVFHFGTHRLRSHKTMSWLFKHKALTQPKRKTLLPDAAYTIFT